MIEEQSHSHNTDNVVTWKVFHTQEFLATSDYLSLFTDFL